MEFFHTKGGSLSAWAHRGLLGGLLIAACGMTECKVELTRVFITNPPEGTTFTTEEVVNIEAEANGLQLDRVEFFDRGTLVGTDTQPPYSHSWSVTAADNGEHQWRAKAFDSEGKSWMSSIVRVDVEIEPGGSDRGPCTGISFIPDAGRVRGVTVADGMAYLGSQSFGLSLADVTQSSNPRIVGASEEPFFGREVAVSGTRAAVIGPTDDDHVKITVLDLSASQPQVLGEVATTALYTETKQFDIALGAGGSLAVAALDAGGVYVVDLSQPESPTFSHVPGTAYGVVLDSTGTLAFVAKAFEGLMILAISDPSQPMAVGSFTSPGLIARDTTLSDDEERAYVANQNGGIFSVDVTNVEAPQYKGAVQTGFLRRMVQDGNLIATLSGTLSNTLEVYTLADRDRPKLVQGSALVVGDAGDTWDLEVVNDKAYVAAGDEGLKVIDLTQSSPTEMGSVSSEFDPRAIDVVGDTAVVVGEHRPTGTSLLRIVDVASANDMNILGERRTEHVVTIEAGFLDVAVNAAGELVVIANGTYGLTLVDISNRASPEIITTYDTPGTAYGVTLNQAGNLAFVADGPGDLLVLDISAPNQPEFVSTTSLSGIMRDVALSDDEQVVFLSNQQGGLKVVDVSNPAAPQFIGVGGTSGVASHIDAEGSLVAVLSTSTSQMFLDLFDVSDPQRPAGLTPLALGSPSTTVGAEGVSLREGIAYVATGAEGLKIIDVSAPGDAFVEGSISPVGNAAGIVVDGSVAFMGDSAATLTAVCLP